MKRIALKLSVVFLGISLMTLAGCTSSSDSVPVKSSAASQQSASSVEARLKTFDELDFDVYSNQKWDRLSESHADDTVVTYPDGHQTKGLKAHIDELKPQFVFAPDTKISSHPMVRTTGHA